jgi:hypothetical protein
MLMMYSFQVVRGRHIGGFVGIFHRGEQAAFSSLREAHRLGGKLHKAGAARRGSAGA